MNAKQLHRVAMAQAIVRHSFPFEQTIAIGEVFDRCRVSDVAQVAWELEKVGIKVTAEVLLAMALSKSVVRTVAEQFQCQMQQEQAKKTVTRTGDKRST